MKYRHILFDFDGVLAQTNEIRFQGFAELFPDITGDQSARFMSFVKANGGLSRYGKIRYLYENVLHEPISESDVNRLAGEYSRLVTERIIEAPAVPGSLECLDAFSGTYDLAIVSGSDQQELRNVCRARGIDHYFVEILGSPKEKRDNILGLLSSRAWENQECVYVGDALNDRDAAAEVAIGFIGRNSGMVDWTQHGEVWISDLRELATALEELSKFKKSKGGNP